MTIKFYVKLQVSLDEAQVSKRKEASIVSKLLSVISIVRSICWERTDPNWRCGLAHRHWFWL